MGSCAQRARIGGGSGRGEPRALGGPSRHQPGVALVDRAFRSRISLAPIPEPSALCSLGDPLLSALLPSNCTCRRRSSAGGRSRDSVFWGQLAELPRLVRSGLWTARIRAGAAERGRPLGRGALAGSHMCQDRYRASARWLDIQGCGVARAVGSPLPPRVTCGGNSRGDLAGRAPDSIPSPVWSSCALAGSPESKDNVRASFASDVESYRDSYFGGCLGLSV